MKDKMKIGILTFHHAYNYGAFLQCYALQEMLKSLGHDVRVIDYNPRYFREDYAVVNFSGFNSLSAYRKARRVLGGILLFIPRMIRRMAFLKIMKTCLDIDDQSFSDIGEMDASRYDAIFFGSDQIWNPKITRGFDRVFWGDFNFKGRKIAYAASAGDDLSLIERDVDYIRRRLLSFSAVSVRERTLRDYLNQAGVKSDFVVDPSLLLDDGKWSEFAGDEKFCEKYLLLYVMKPSPNAKKITAKIAKELHLKVKEIFPSSGLNPKSWMNASCSPVDFVRLFRDAEFVVTTSFHGTSFAVNFHKEFYAVNTGSQNLRVESLLSELGLMNRYIRNEEEVAIWNKVEYMKDRLDTVRRKSMGFIQSALNSCTGVFYL